MSNNDVLLKRRKEYFNARSDVKAAKIGVKIVDYDKFRSHTENESGGTFFLLLVLLAFMIGFLWSTHRFEQAAEHCVLYFSNMSTSQTISVCTKVLYG
jgi:flagellar biogenesis protein FliO